MKRLFTIILSILLTFSFVACSCASSNVVATNNGNDDDPAVIIDSVDDPQPIELVEPEPEPTKTVEPEPVVEPEEPEPDPNEILTMEYITVDEDWFKSIGGAVGFVRDGVTYGLADITNPDNFETAGMGVFKKSSNEALICFRGDWGNDKIIVDDRFVIPVVSDDDVISWYGDPINSLELIPMSFYGYTVPILQNNDKCTALTVFDNGKRDYDSSLLISQYHDKSTELIDSNNVNVFDDFRNLNQGEYYTLKWNDGSDHEEQLEACWRYYKPTGAEAITVSGSPSDDPQITHLDFSGVPDGTYFLAGSYTLVEIKND